MTTLLQGLPGAPPSSDSDGDGKPDALGRLYQAKWLLLVLLAVVGCAIQYAPEIGALLPGLPSAPTVPDGPVSDGAPPAEPTSGDAPAPTESIGPTEALSSTATVDEAVADTDVAPTED